MEESIQVAELHMHTDPSLKNRRVTRCSVYGICSTQPEQLRSTSQFLYPDKFMGDNVVRMWMQVKRWCVLQRRLSGDVCELVSTLCKYDLGNGDVFVLI